MRHNGLRWVLTAWMVLIQAWAPLVHAHVGDADGVGLHVHIEVGGHAAAPTTPATFHDDARVSPHDAGAAVCIAQGLKNSTREDPGASPDPLFIFLWPSLSDASPPHVPTSADHGTPLGERRAYSAIPRAPPVTL